MCAEDSFLCPVHTNIAALAPIRSPPRPAPPRPRRAQWLAEELPRVRRLAASIRSDLAVRVAPLGRVNLPLHFLSRASVALVPFGVMTVNLLGACRSGGRAAQGAAKHAGEAGQPRCEGVMACGVQAGSRTARDEGFQATTPHAKCPSAP